jgi:hypothetical protein
MKQSFKLVYNKYTQRAQRLRNAKAAAKAAAEEVEIARTLKPQELDLEDELFVP